VQDGRYSLVDVGVAMGEEGDQDIDFRPGIPSPFPHK
jgi:hypothetical protein